MVTARHAALRLGGHFVAAIYRVLGTGWHLPVMMAVNRALASGRAASARVESPGGSAEGRVHEGDRD